MSCSPKKKTSKRKATELPGDVLPQLEYNEKEKLEWHQPLQRIKLSPKLNKTVSFVDTSLKSPIKRKRDKNKGIGYIEMLDKRKNFRSSLIKAFRSDEMYHGLHKSRLTAEETQWLKYEYYLRKLIPKEAVSPLMPRNIKKILNLVPENLKINMEKEIKRTVHAIKEEYIWIVKKATVDCLIHSTSPKKSVYDPSSRYYKEMATLNITGLHLQRLIRIVSNLYILSNKCIQKLLEVWLHIGAELSFFKVTSLKQEEPYEIDAYLQKVKMEILNVQDTLYKKWYPLVQRAMNVGLKRNMIPVERKSKFFNCVAAIMTSQLKSLCYDSLCNYEKAVCHFQEYVGCLKIKLVFCEENYVLEPDIAEIEKILMEPFTLMHLSVSYFPRVEMCLDEDPVESSRYNLKTRLPENVIENIKRKARDSLRKEWKEALSLVDQFEKYKFLYAEKAKLELKNFLDNEHTLEELKEKYTYYIALKQEMEVQKRESAKRGMYVVDCSQVFEHLSQATSHLLHYLVDSLEKKLSFFTSNLTDEYDALTVQLKIHPKNTKELFDSKDYVKNFLGKKLEELKKNLQLFTCWIYYLSEIVIFTTKSFEKHAKIYKMHMDLPKVIHENTLVLKNSMKTFQENLIERRKMFSEDLNTHSHEIESLAHLANPDLVKKYLGHSNDIEKWLLEVENTIELFNSEEEAFEWEMTSYPLRLKLVNELKPYTQLYTLAVDYSKKEIEWLNGSIHEVDPELVEQQVLTIWRSLYKLEKTFSDVPAPKKIAKKVRENVEKFKDNLPLVQTLCNPGLRDRHWDQISEIVGFPLKSDKSTTLQKLIGLNLREYIPQFESISEAASKEYKLEKALDKMMEEWSEMMFSVIPFRESGTFVLSSVDEIQLLLDDHIIKTQTMRGSPSVKPIEGRVKSWESKLMHYKKLLMSG